jgi:2-iminobutanoate/2-iminopropanoate deaminase
LFAAPDLFLSELNVPKVVKTSKAPKPSGVYSQGIVSGDFVFVAGQGPINPEDNQLELGDIRSETRRVLKNIRAILEAAGSSLRSIVRVGVFLADLNDFEGMNEVFQEFFAENPPARTTVGCALPEIKVEIDCIARLDSTSRVRGRKRNSIR